MLLQVWKSTPDIVCDTLESFNCIKAFLKLLEAREQEKTNYSHNHFDNHTLVLHCVQIYFVTD